MTFHLLRYVTLILRKVAIPLLLPLNLKAELANLFIFLKGGHYIFDRDLNAIWTRLLWKWKIFSNSSYYNNLSNKMDKNEVIKIKTIYFG